MSADDERWPQLPSPAKRQKQDTGQAVEEGQGGHEGARRDGGIEEDFSDVGYEFERAGEDKKGAFQVHEQMVSEQSSHVPLFTSGHCNETGPVPFHYLSVDLQTNVKLNHIKLNTTDGGVRQCSQESQSLKTGAECLQECLTHVSMPSCSHVTTVQAMDIEMHRHQHDDEAMRGDLGSVGDLGDLEDLESYARAVLHEGLGEWTRFLYYLGPSKTKNSPVKYKVCRTLLLDEVLCSDRVSQMTKTYNDIEAVTRLLAEKEKDLELTARIGKQLLDQNNKYESNIASLEAELKLANDRLTQLSHELLKKTELIQILTNDVDDSSSESGTPNGLRCINLDLMQRRIGSLEDENRSLRKEASQLFSDTAECEEAEQRLVRDIASQLANANMEVDSIADELAKYREESRIYHDESIVLATKLYEADNKIDKLSVDNEDLSSVLHITKENQCLLTTELADLKDRYSEVMSLLHETQEQLRRQRKKSMPTARGGLFPSLGSSALFNPDSLASELECSLYSELSADSGISTDRLPNYKKVFETVRSASRNSNCSGASANASPVHQMYPRVNPLQPFGYPGNTTVLSSTTTSGPRMSCVVSSLQSNSGRPPLEPQRNIGSAYGYGSSLSFPSMDSMGHSDSEYSTTSEDYYPGAPPRGVPGVPGAADLEAALRRLTPAQVISRRSALSSGSYEYSDGIHTPPSFLPFGCRTPDSIMSTGSSGFSNNSNGWKLPEKLQIVKPLEGSLTLATWSQLATPTLGGLLDERPGVQTRGGKQLEDLGLKMYTLSDLEEDEEYGNPGKSFQNTGSVYTFTNSTVLHPDDMTSVTHSLRGSQMTTASSSRQPTAPQTPVGRSRRNSTSTFSTALGLAKMLNERGIKAVTPSCVTTPTYTPTATPCNSPDGSPPQSRSSSPMPYSPLNFPGFLSSGADLLRRTFSSEMERAHMSRKSKHGKVSLSRSDRKVLSGIRIVEQLERIGLETIMATSASAVLPTLNLGGALYTCRTLKSPMAQLAGLKPPVTPTSPGSTSLGPPEEAARQVTGKPPRPGGGAGSNDRLGRSPPRKGKVRPDLGTVHGTVATGHEPTSTLGTISTMLFGRKGGLL